jgi:hypothetical protein
MFNRSDSRRARMIRGVVLQLLYLAGNGEALNASDPFCMNYGILVSALQEMRQLPPLLDLGNAVRYLEERKYIEVVWAKGVERSGEWEAVRLTTTGIDLVEATTTDPGVIVPPLR